MSSELTLVHPACPQAGVTDLKPAESGPGFDPAAACPARLLVYKDHYPPYHAAEEEIRRCPRVVAGARTNRAFLARVVRFLATKCGIRQFVDIGTGLPVPGNTHDVAQRIASDCRVVCVDNDPLVLVRAHALLISTRQGSCDYIDADLRDVPAVLAAAARTLDLTQPAAVLLLGVLHFIPDADEPDRIVGALASALAPGSFVVISHLTGDLAPGQVTAGAAACNTPVPANLIPRTFTQVTSLFAGLPLVPPGIVPLTEWRPAVGALPAPADMYAGVARTPGARM